MISTGISWRDTARPICLGFLDARCGIGLGAWMLHMCWETFYLSIILIVVFFGLGHFGVTPPAAWRWFKQSLFENFRNNLSSYQTRRNSRW